MGLAEVRRAITKTAHADAETVLERARAEAAEMIRVTNGRIATERATFDKQTSVMLDVMERRETAAAHAQSKARILEAKRRAVDATFAGASDELDMLSGDERARFIATLCERVKDEIIVARIRAAPTDIPVIGRAFPQAHVLADNAIHGGFVATNAEGTVSVDLTFAAILADVHDRELLPVSAILFGQQAPTSRSGRMR